MARDSGRRREARTESALAIIILIFKIVLGVFAAVMMILTTIRLIKYVQAKDEIIAETSNEAQFWINVAVLALEIIGCICLILAIICEALLSLIFTLVMMIALLCYKIWFKAKLAPKLNTEIEVFQNDFEFYGYIVFCLLLLCYIIILIIDVCA